jgi:membrane protease YdiL (CAAX protease family)
MAALPVVVAVSLAASFIFRGIDTPSHPAIMELASSRDFLTIFLLFVQASILAPLSEELMFRGVFFRSLTPKMRWIPAMVIASSVFAILHPQLPLGFFGLFTLGATFNILYALRGSLLPAIVAHALNNTVILIAVLLIFGS